MNESAATEPMPESSRAIFGSSLGQIEAFARNLAERGPLLGLIGPSELSRIWTRHIENCGLMAGQIGPGRIADIGSGAGLPGLVLAIMKPESQFVLVEPMERRVDWLHSQIQELGLENVEVFRGRAEEAKAGEFDQVTARAVGSISKLAPLAARLLKPSGEMLLLKGERVLEELEAAQKIVRKFKLDSIEVLTLGAEYGTETTRLFRAKVD